MGQYLARIGVGWLIADTGALLLAEVMRSGGHGKAGYVLLLLLWIAGPVHFMALWWSEGSRRDSIVATERQKQRNEEDRKWQEAMRPFWEYIHNLQEAETLAAKRKASDEAKQAKLQAELQAQAEKEAKELVYFIVNRQQNTVKIGVSISPEKRLRQLQTSNPHRLELARTLTGGYRTERQLHEKYAKHRLSGEWFHLAPEIMKQIEGPNGQARLKVA